MARRKRKSLGSSAAEHRDHARTAAEYLRQDVKSVRRLLKRGDCKNALHVLTTAHRSVAAMLVERRGAGATVRSTNTGSVYQVAKLTDRVHACYVGKK